MQPSFLFKRLLQQRLTIVIRYYMVYLQNVIKQLQRVQNVAAYVVTLSPKFCQITPVLGISTGFRLIFGMGLNLKYLLLLTRLSMDLLVLILKIFFKVASRKGILCLQEKSASRTCF